MKSVVSVNYKISIPALIRKRYNIKEKMCLKWIDNGHSINILPVSNLTSVYKDYFHKLNVEV